MFSRLPPRSRGPVLQKIDGCPVLCSLINCQQSSSIIVHMSTAVMTPVPEFELRTIHEGGKDFGSLVSAEYGMSDEDGEDIAENIAMGFEAMDLEVHVLLMSVDEQLVAGMLVVVLQECVLTGCETVHPSRRRNGYGSKLLTDGAAHAVRCLGAQGALGKGATTHPVISHAATEADDEFMCSVIHAHPCVTLTTEPPEEAVQAITELRQCQSSEVDIYYRTDVAITGC